jgi:outer membrane biosynthesis protein TonB
LSQAPLRHARSQVRLALLVVVALLGVAAAYPFAGGSRAAIAGTTTTPAPDPAPTTTAAPKPEPARHPAPPPAQTYAPPPPPPVEAAQPRHVAVTPTRPKHRPPPAVKKEKAPAAGSAPRLLRPRPPAATAAPAIGPLTTSSARLSGTLELFLAAVFALALLVAGLALAPAELLPAPISDLVFARREALVSAAGALVLGLAAGLVVLAVS